MVIFAVMEEEQDVLICYGLFNKELNQNIMCLDIYMKVCYIVYLNEWSPVLCQQWRSNKGLHFAIRQFATM